MRAIRLGVNIDHVATVRQARRGTTPDPLDAAHVCARAGADRVVCHLREDRRHIQAADVARLRQDGPIPLNLEMSIAASVVRTALRIRPPQVTLVPERRQELTTEGGLDVVRQQTRLARVTQRFHEQGITVSLFVDPTPVQLEASIKAGARIVELHTGRYANARTPASRRREYAVLTRAAAYAHRLGLIVVAGHGLDYENTPAIVRIPNIEELNIGFSIISRALFVGLERAVREMKALMRCP